MSNYTYTAAEGDGPAPAPQRAGRDGARRAAPQRRAPPRRGPRPPGHPGAHRADDPARRPQGGAPRSGDTRSRAGHQRRPCAPRRRTCCPPSSGRRRSWRRRTSTSSAPRCVPGRARALARALELSSGITRLTSARRPMSRTRTALRAMVASSSSSPHSPATHSWVFATSAEHGPRCRTSTWVGSVAMLPKEPWSGRGSRRGRRRPRLSKRLARPSRRTVFLRGLYAMLPGTLLFPDPAKAELWSTAFRKANSRFKQS